MKELSLRKAFYIVCLMCLCAPAFAQGIQVAADDNNDDNERNRLVITTVIIDSALSARVFGPNTILDDG